MNFKKQLKPLQKPSPLLCILMGLLTLSSFGCAVPIKDARFCAPIPLVGGAVCDWMLHSDQKILTEAEWNELQGSWVQKNDSAVCTQSSNIGSFKAELEKLCSVSNCSFEQIKPALEALDKIAVLGKVKLP